VPDDLPGRIVTHNIDMDNELGDFEMAAAVDLPGHGDSSEIELELPTIRKLRVSDRSYSYGYSWRHGLPPRPSLKARHAASDRKVGAGIDSGHYPCGKSGASWCLQPRGCKE
jgi:hypothetical protein